MKELSMYYVTSKGLLCITFPSSSGEKAELCTVIGLQNETWFKHKEMTNERKE